MSVRKVESLVSTGITAFALYVIKKGVSLVEWSCMPIAHSEALLPIDPLNHLASFQAIYNGLVGRLCLTIALWIRGSRIPVDNSQF